MQLQARVASATGKQRLLRLTVQIVTEAQRSDKGGRAKRIREKFTHQQDIFKIAPKRPKRCDPTMATLVTMMPTATATATVTRTRLPTAADDGNDDDDRARNDDDDGAQNVRCDSPSVPQLIKRARRRRRRRLRSKQICIFH